MGLVFLLTVHLLGGLRLLVLENFAWREGQKTIATFCGRCVCARRLCLFVSGGVMERLQTDVLILGSGGAGLFAALHAKDANPGLSVTIATKGLLGKCGCTRMVQGGYNVALNPGDSVERHFMDTIEGGKWLPHQGMAWTLVSRRRWNASASWKTKSAASLTATRTVPCTAKPLPARPLTGQCTKVT